jgi:hypothetical protein
MTLKKWDRHNFHCQYTNELLEPVTKMAIVGANRDILVVVMGNCNMLIIDLNSGKQSDIISFAH